MCWQCDNPGGTTEEYLAELHGTMLKSGWAVQYVESDRMPFAYTVGLAGCGVPELLVTGVSPRRALRMLNSVAQRALGGDRLTPGMQLTIPAGPIVEMVEVEHPHEHLIFAVAILGNDVTALQLVWADRRGRWPWAAEFDDGRGTQAVLGVRTVSN
jgi:hypothetical protein